MDEYDNLVKLLTRNTGADSSSQLQKISAQQQESIQRLGQRSIPKPKSLPAQEDPMKECTFHPQIISRSKDYVHKEKDPHIRLYEQAKQKQEILHRKIEEKKLQEAIERENEKPTFQPVLISSSRSRNRAERDAFNALYNDAIKQKAKRDEQAITFTTIDTFKPKTHTRAFDRESTIQTIVDQLSNLH
ncbi:Hypothetical protein GLP15_405 [Giardia lamblia P15]|uniref:Uncharacterized protein n=1 Tax=Giardia intestinalis (strain P15) TaxID=658858 RepID=E1EXF2_GIAIA|nr:Hypothetical protein GLP15_405 [Giardia lamblia P15]